MNGRLHENLQRVQDQMSQALRLAGRPADSVTLVAVTKYVAADLTAALWDAGCTHLGESRPQQLWSKASQIDRDPITWHLIGHLQKNKVKKTVAIASWIHSVDSLDLLRVIEHHAAASQRRLRLLLEVNISGDATKQGLSESTIVPVLEEAAGCRFAQVCGLMGMASLHGGREQARHDFAKLRQLRDRLATQVAPPVELRELSMGMSQDFDVAILEGATMVRVGSRLFEGVV